MPSLPDLIRHQIDYSAWANLRLLAAASALTVEERTRDFGTADKSVEGTLLHLFRSERVWLKRIREGIGSASSGISDDGWTSVQRDWPQLGQQWQEWASTCTEAAGEQTLQYKDLKGNARQEPLWQIILHVVNHSTHHRGQALGFVRALGKTPPSLDLIAYVREQQAAANVTR
jgi:uncharacterized damage-inducible protein DinB